MPSNKLTSLTIQQLRRAVALKEQIDSLENELAQVFGAPFAKSSIEARPAKKRRSGRTRARMAAAQRARWSNLRTSKPQRVAAKPKRRMSAAGRARIAAAAKARWAKVKAAGEKTLAG